MANFIVRVELSGRNPNYTFLRDGLINLGFTKRVTDKDGIEWRLPNGNYRIESNATKDQIITAVQGVAFRLERNPMIFVTQIEPKGMIWSGLQRC